RESAEKLVSEPEGLSLEDAAPPPTFDDLWGAYPIDTRMSRDLALLEWEKLDPRQRRAAFNAIAKLLAWINEAPSDPERAVPSAEMWLGSERWQRWWSGPHL